MPTYKQDIKATTGNSPVNQVAGAASGFNPDQSMAGYMLQQGGGLSGMVDSMQNYRNQKNKHSTQVKALEFFQEQLLNDQAKQLAQCLEAVVIYQNLAIEFQL